MLRLYILRHAKATIAAPGMKDFERGLSERGTDDARRLGALMRELNMLPQAILCSPARRTRMTLHAIMGAFENDQAPQIDYDEQLYAGEPGDYWKALHSFKTIKSAMLIGHNPMCEIVASAIAGGGDKGALTRLRSSFPTSGLAVFDFSGDSWRELREGDGRLTRFVVPGDMAK